MSKMLMLPPSKPSKYNRFNRTSKWIFDRKKPVYQLPRWMIRIKRKLRSKLKNIHRKDIVCRMQGRCLMGNHILKFLWLLIKREMLLILMIFGYFVSSLVRKRSIRKNRRQQQLLFMHQNQNENNKFICSSFGMCCCCCFLSYSFLYSLVCLQAIIFRICFPHFVSFSSVSVCLVGFTVFIVNN